MNTFSGFAGMRPEASEQPLRRADDYPDILSPSIVTQLHCGHWTQISDHRWEIERSRKRGSPDEYWDDRYTAADRLVQ
jgi:hypothetical protein